MCFSYLGVWILSILDSLIKPWQYMPLFFTVTVTFRGVLASLNSFKTCETKSKEYLYFWGKGYPIYYFKYYFVKVLDSEIHWSIKN